MKCKNCGGEIMFDVCDFFHVENTDCFNLAAEDSEKFTDVSLDRKLRAHTDGMPVFRNCMEHETMMTFLDDDGNYAFNEWWNSVGSVLFNRYYKYVYMGKIR